MKTTFSFENTEVAFSGKSNKDLHRAYWLFKLIGYPALMRIGKVMTKVGLALQLPIRGLVKRTIFKQFCGGETIAECMDTGAELERFRIGTILDYSVEGQEKEHPLDMTASEILATIRAAQVNPNIPFCVFKTSGIASNKVLYKVSEGINLSPTEKGHLERIEARIEQICSAAELADTPIFIDAEESWIQPAIDQFATNMMRRHNTKKPIVYNTIQLYRKDRLEFLKKSYEEAVAGDYYLGEKLVRGAYMEKERERAEEKGYSSPIHDTKEGTDRDFDAALDFCIEHIDRISFCAGTHNEESSMYLTALMEKHHISPDDQRVFFAQLYGMSDHISYNLAQKGYRVAKYVPYGPVRKVLPYLIRRAEENTSASGQTGRELRLIQLELERRKSERK